MSTNSKNITYVFGKFISVMFLLSVLAVHFFSFGMHYTFGSSVSQLVIINSIYFLLIFTIALCFKRKHLLAIFGLSFMSLVFPKILGFLSPHYFSIYSPFNFQGEDFFQLQLQFLFYCLILSGVLALVVAWARK